MKLVIAIVQPSKVDPVRERLLEAGVMGMTVSEVRGFGQQKGHTESYRGAEYTVDFLPKMKIEVAVPESKVDEVLGIIGDAARSGKVGDGKIFVTPVEKAVRIRTQEMDEAAL